MVALFDGNPNTSLVINFAPVEGSEEAEEHLNLSNTVSDIPKHHMIIIECGDFNAHIGRNEAKYTYHTETNITMEKCYLRTLKNVVSESQIRYSKRKWGNCGPTSLI